MSGALKKSIGENNIAAVKEWLDGRVNVNILFSDGCSPLALACFGGRNEMVRMFCDVPHTDVNMSVHIKDVTFTALYIGAAVGNIRVVEILLAHPTIDVNKTAHDGGTPLTAASFKGHTDIVELLLARDDINVNHSSNKSSAAIVQAAVQGHFSIFKKLLCRNDIEINSASVKTGNTTLHFAAHDNQVEIVRLLVNRDDLDPFIVNNDGQTALDRCQPRSACRQLIAEAMKRKNQQTVERKRMEMQRLANEITEIELADVRKEISETTNNLQTLDEQITTVVVDFRNMISQVNQLNAQLELKTAEEQARKTPLEERLQTLRERERLLVDRQPNQATDSQANNPPAHIIECPMCLDEMRAPKRVFQCADGHPYCSECAPNITRCPICRKPLPQETVRCRVLEDLINNTL